MPVYAGNIVRAGDSFTAWTPFTPTFQGFTVGNGTVYGEWRRVGSYTIEVMAQFIMGSTSAVGAALGLTVPAGLSVDGSSVSQIMPAMAWDNSAATGYAGVMKLQSGGGTLYDRFYGASSIAWNTTVPFTWATSDFLTVQGYARVTT